MTDKILDTLALVHAGQQVIVYINGSQYGELKACFSTSQWIDIEKAAMYAENHYGRPEMGERGGERNVGMYNGILLKQKAPPLYVIDATGNEMQPALIVHEKL